MSFASPERQRSSPALPMAAMVDILFLLLVFFMTSSLYREDAMLVEVSLPPVGEGLSGGASNAVYINVDDEDRIFHGDIEYDLPTLRTTLAQLHEQFPNEAVVVRGDKGASHGRVMEVRDAAAEAKFSRVYYGVVKKGSELTP